MTSRTSADFRRDFALLPPAIHKQARSAFKLFTADPHHPSLRFKKLPPHADLWSVRITNDYRAVGRWRGDVILWFFIGSHTDYQKLLDRIDL
ncbi:MAG: hypothetical protein WBL15_08060 [Phycisphaerae bacterium]|jgi:hypothetical protein|nr:hypothetical protein [Phycisphaerae bacterium]HPP22363.1 hypothetical protein [Phycisphaerae bacterium]